MKKSLRFSILLLVTAIFVAGTPTSAQDLGSLISPGPLSFLHKEIEGITSCIKCHSIAAGIPNEKCIDCHKDIESRIKASRGYHATVKDKKCIDCHSDHKGRKNKLISWDEKSFDHTKSGYDLTGKHAKTACDKCHVVKTKKGQKSYLGLDRVCLSCHKKDDKHKGKLGKQCEDCHTTTDWKTVKFKHEKTKYPLRGKHVKVECGKCHAGKKRGEFQVANFSTCDAPGCHDTKKRGNIHDKQFQGQRCDDCHTVNGFMPPLFKHEAEEYKGYKLDGKHLELKCESCHRKPLFSSVRHFKPIESKSCDAPGCHDTKKRGNIHGKQFEGQRCDSCHTTKGFKEELFKHNGPEYSGYKLEGKHSELKCESCHKKALFSGIAKYKPIEYKTCDAPGCHDIKKRGNIHGKQFEGQRCDSCHTVKGFKQPLFKHDDPEYKGYKLEGKHAELKCEQCHQKSAFSGIRHFKPIETKSCDSGGCHDTKERGNIHGNQFEGQRCDSCHTVKGFKELTFDHNKQSRFVLIGKHKKTECKKCHVEKKWKPLEVTCIACHKKDDKHKGEFGKDCDSCHSAKNWQPQNFFHELTGFKLDGAHAQTVCEDCHTVKGQFSGLARECASCHIEPHFNQFGADCTDCHTAKNWMPQKFRHSNTGFRLEGAHRNRECEDCHTNRQYKISSPDCIACHASDFQNAALNTFHQNANRDCQECHRVYSFLPALKHPHQVMTFSGAHIGIKSDCTSCHNRSDWSLIGPGANLATTTASDCVDCHQAVYAANPNPAHAIGNTDCTSCHSNNAWLPATYNHVAMTFSGAHIAVKNSCNSCHQPGSVNLIAAFTGATTASDCDICHAADFAAATNSSHDTGNTNCAQCHTQAAWLPANAGHTTMTFTGRHSSIESSCNNCHLPNSATLIFSGAGFELDCEDCHNNPNIGTGNDVYYGDEHGGQSGCDPTWCSDCHRTADPDFDAGRNLHGGACK